MVIRNALLIAMLLPAVATAEPDKPWYEKLTIRGYAQLRSSRLPL